MYVQRTLLNPLFPFTSLVRLNLFRLGAPNPGRRNGNIIIPESIRVSSVALPSKVNRRHLRLNRAPLPLRCIWIRRALDARQARDNLAVQPRLDAPVGAELILEALPASGGEGCRGGDTLRGEVREGGVVGFAVVHEDGVLAADAEVLLGALGGVGHGDEADVGGGEGF